MDAFSEVLNSVRLEGALYLDVEFTAPWCIRGKCGMATVRKWLPGADHVVYFHFLREGTCKVRLDDSADALDVGAGDLVLFPQDDRHVMGSDLHLTPFETEALVWPDVRPTDLIPIRMGGGGARTRFVCGYLGCSHALIRPLIGALPRVLRIPVGDGEGSALVQELFRAAVRESTRPEPGAGSTLARMAELLFVEALRRHLARLPQEERSWLAAVRDTHVGRALSLLHESPSRDWTVDELARAVALSRSALAERFTTLIGEPPMQYLKRWRLALAARTLHAGSASIGRIADQCGYESEAAFTRAFKREFGVPPREWRKARAP